MAGTSSGAGGAAGRAPAADQVRNVVLVGHSGTGKSSLVEALLAATGTIQRPGSIEEGTTVSDFDETEVRQQRSVNLTLAPISHNGIKVNLLDTPGYADFTGDLRAGLRAADSALFAVSATDGIDGVTRMLWEECAAVGMPRAVVITKIDHQRADFQATLDACREAFGDAVAPLYLPVGEPVTGLIGLLSQKLYSYSGGERSEGAPAAAEEAAGEGPCDPERARRRLGVEWFGEAAVDRERLSNRRWHFGKGKTNSHGLSTSRRPLDFRDTDEGTLGVDGDSSNRMPGSRCQMHEVKRLTSQPAAHGYDGIDARNGRVECQSHDGSGLGPSGYRRQSCRLCSERPRKQGANSDRCYKAFHVWRVSVEFHRS